MRLSYLIVGIVALAIAWLILTPFTQPDGMRDSADSSKKTLKTAEGTTPTQIIRDTNSIGDGIKELRLEDKARMAEFKKAQEQNPMPTAGPGEETPEQYRASIENNHQFIKEVLVPRVKLCWDSVEGAGEIVFSHSFRIENGVAYPGYENDSDEPFIVERSTLSEDADIAAIDCMKKATIGVSYPYIDLNGNSNLLSGESVVIQVWPSYEEARTQVNSKSKMGGWLLGTQ